MKSPRHRLFLSVIFLEIFFFFPPDSRALAVPADAGIEARPSPAEVARRFLDAYPDFLIAYDAATQELIGWDGARFPVNDGWGNNCKENAAPPCCPPPSPMATLRIPYRSVAEHWPTADDPPLPGEDAGRLRPLALWIYMYGAPAGKNADGSWQAKKVGKRVELAGGAVEKNLAPVAWKLAAKPARIRVSRVNGVNQQLAAAVAELDTIGAEAKSRYRRLHGGGRGGVSGFYPRMVRGNACEISPHAFGVAVDIHWRADLDYWLDSPQGGGYRYRSVMPQEIVAAFERHGFIWGGKWRHFDGMHFEYRPELLSMTMPSVGRPSLDRPSVSKPGASKSSKSKRGAAQRTENRKQKIGKS
jgi:hypothetical protein